MSILDNVRAWLAPKQSVSDTGQKLQRVLRASMEIVSAYGAVLERGTYSKLPTIKRSEQELPYNKQSMGNTLTPLTVALAISLVVLAGCASSPVPHSETILVPSSRVLAPELLSERQGAAKITIKRDSGFIGSACTYRVFIDGRPVAQLRTGERVDFFVDPGQHILGTYGEGFCGGGTAEVETSVGAGQWKSYRIASGQDGTLQLLPTAF